VVTLNHIDTRATGCWTLELKLLLIINFNNNYFNYKNFRTRNFTCCLHFTQYTWFQDLHCQEQSSALLWALHHHGSISLVVLVHQIHDRSESQYVHQLLPHSEEGLWSQEPKLKETVIVRIDTLFPRHKAFSRTHARTHIYIFLTYNVFPH
jgi:hypothetical protein